MRKSDEISRKRAAAAHAPSRTQRSIATMSPVSSATGMNVAGLSRPELGVIPADQRLTADDARCVRIDQRLELEPQLAATRRQTQADLEREALDDLGVHALVVDRQRSSAVFLHVVHRRVGVRGERLGVGAVVGKHGAADAHADADFAVAQRDRRADRTDEARDDLLDLAGRTDASQQDDELVAARPRDEVAVPERMLQTDADLAQNLVARAVPHGVVDRLETVQIEEEQAEAASRFAGVGDRLVQTRLERGAVRQPGEPVVVRGFEKLPLRPLQFGDVEGDADRADDRPAAVCQRLDVMAQPAFAVRLFDACRTAVEHVADHRFVDQHRARAMDEVVDAQPEIVESTAGDTGEAGVPRDGPQDGVDVVRDELQAVHALVQLRLGQRQRADVLQRDQGLARGRKDANLDPALLRGGGVKPLDRNAAAAGGQNVGDQLGGERVDQRLERGADRFAGAYAQ